MLSPVLLERLRVWWRVAHAQGRMLKGGWLFPGLDPVDPLSTRQLNRAIHAAAEAAHIDMLVERKMLPWRHGVACRDAAGLSVGFLCHAKRHQTDPGSARLGDRAAHGRSVEGGGNV